MFSRVAALWGDPPLSPRLIMSGFNSFFFTTFSFLLVHQATFKYHFTFTFWWKTFSHSTVALYYYYLSVDLIVFISLSLSPRLYSPIAIVDIGILIVYTFDLFDKRYPFSCSSFVAALSVSIRYQGIVSSSYRLTCFVSTRVILVGQSLPLIHPNSIAFPLHTGLY
jgi:hypothetical protein